MNTDKFTSLVAYKLPECVKLIHVLIYSRSRSYFFRSRDFIRDFKIVMGPKLKKVVKFLYK